MSALLLIEAARGATSEAVELQALTQAAGEGLAATRQGTPTSPHRGSKGMETREASKGEEVTTTTRTAMDEAVVTIPLTRASNRALTALRGQILVRDRYMYNVEGLVM